MTPAILLIIFNRPALTQTVFDAIRLARPTRLYIAADGPRLGRPGEAAKCQQAREVANQIDWPCEVQTLFQETNLGCREGVSTAITWFFQHEPEGIILEDDILPDASFFPYCAELLERYRDDPRIMAITGINRQPESRSYDHSYYFSCYNHVWGWASWRRAWDLYDRKLDRLEHTETADALKQISKYPRFAKYWLRCLREVRDGKNDTWDYSWMLTCWMNRGLTCTPKSNLIKNLGFGPDATHTFDDQSELANLKASSLEFPLHHPEFVQRSIQNDNYVSVSEYGIHSTWDIKTRLRRLLKKANKERFQKLLIKISSKLGLER